MTSLVLLLLVRILRMSEKKKINFLSNQNIGYLGLPGTRKNAIFSHVCRHPEPKSARIRGLEAYGDLEFCIGFHLSPNSACPRLSRVS